MPTWAVASQLPPSGLHQPVTPLLIILAFDIACDIAWTAAVLGHEVPGWLP